MKPVFSRSALLLLVAFAAVVYPACGQTSYQGWVPSTEPGATPGVELINISKNTSSQGSVFPQVAVSRSDPNFIAVAWRRYALPIDTSTKDFALMGQCHVSISKDGGKTFKDIDMMPHLRTPGTPPDPTKARTVQVFDQARWLDYQDPGPDPPMSACNAPWVTIAKDGTIFFGGAIYTGGYPRQGRAGLSVSHDGGATWSKMVYGIDIAKFAPGVTGLNGGMDPWNTPWDGANGVVDPMTDTFYSTAGAVIAISDDQAKTFGTVYASGGGTISAAYGVVASAHVVADTTTFPNAQCPCLAFAVSTDKAQTWKQILVAQDGQFNRTGTVRYPVTAADPAHKGSFAIAVYAPDHRSMKVYYTSDMGQTWKMAAPHPVAPKVSVGDVNMADVGYTSDGRLLLTWRAFRGPGAFHTFVAMMKDGAFGPTVKVSPALSIYPPLTYEGNYGIGNGGGDFTTWVQGNNTDAFVAFPYAPGGQVEATYLARVPLSILLAP